MQRSSGVPFNDLLRRDQATTDQLLEAAARVIRSGWFLLGSETEAFEHEFATSCGAPESVAVANGTDALEISLRAVGCEPGDEVVLTANAGMYATNACLAMGAAPVFAEVDAATLLIDSASAASMVTGRTRAVVATHLYGNVVDVTRLRAALPEGVALVEDCAQAHGARLGDRPVGSLGDVAAFSFYPTKNLGALGDAGAVVTSAPDVIARARALRQYGWESRYVATVRGGRNSRMDEMQAAFLRVLLPSLRERNEERRAIRETFVERLGERLEFVRNDTQETYDVAHLCVARSPTRDRLIEDLATVDVSAAVHYPVPDHEQPVLRDQAFRRDGLAETERACREVLSLPCFPGLRADEIDTVVDAVEKFT